MSKKVKEKITMDIDGKIVELNKVEAKTIQRAMKRAENEAALAAMTDDEKKVFKIKRRLKIAGIGAVTIAVVGGVVKLLVGNGKTENGETVLLDESNDDGIDESADIEGTTDEVETGEF